jgi:hypothetical protein
MFNKIIRLIKSMAEYRVSDTVEKQTKLTENTLKVT